MKSIYSIFLCLFVFSLQSSAAGLGKKEDAEGQKYIYAVAVTAKTGSYETTTKKTIYEKRVCFYCSVLAIPEEKYSEIKDKLEGAYKSLFNKRLKSNCSLVSIEIKAFDDKAKAAKALKLRLKQEKSKSKRFSFPLKSIERVI